MPVHKIKKGKIAFFKWGEKGKLYRTKEKALRQGRAIKQSQYQKKMSVKK